MGKKSPLQKKLILNLRILGSEIGLHGPVKYQIFPGNILTRRRVSFWMEMWRLLLMKRQSGSVQEILLYFPKD